MLLELDPIGGSDLEPEKKKKRLPGWAVLLIALAVIQIGAVIWYFHSYPKEEFSFTTENAVQQFLSDVSIEDPEAVTALSPLELGTPKSITSFSHAASDLIFPPSYNCVLLCRYETEDYPAAKAAMEERYVFRTKPLDSGAEKDGEHVMLPPYYRIGDDEFRFVLPEDEPTDQDRHDSFYHRSVIIITNDATHEIGYLFFKDKELDAAEDMERFLTRSCAWEQIREAAGS